MPPHLLASPALSTGALRSAIQILEQPAEEASEGAMQAFIDTLPGKLLADGSRGALILFAKFEYNISWTSASGAGRFKQECHT